MMISEEIANNGAGRQGIGTRRMARELTLQMLFQHDANDSEPEVTAQTFKSYFAPDKNKDDDQSLDISPGDFNRAWPLACELFFGVTTHRAKLDKDIAHASINWTLARMSPVDRGLIRLAYYEMIYRDDIPHKVSLNEALEMAKIYGDEDSGSFINGVLDRLMRSAQAESSEKAHTELVPENIQG